MSAILAKMSPDRRFCLAYKKDRGSVGTARIGFAACPVQANTPSGPGSTHPRVAGASSSRNREACWRPALRGLATLRATKQLLR